MYKALIMVPNFQTLIELVFGVPLFWQPSKRKGVKQGASKNWGYCTKNVFNPLVVYINFNPLEMNEIVHGAR